VILGHLLILNIRYPNLSAKDRIPAEYRGRPNMGQGRKPEIIPDLGNLVKQLKLMDPAKNPLSFMGFDIVTHPPDRRIYAI
jgi:hypothetical protein